MISTLPGCISVASRLACGMRPFQENFRFAVVGSPVPL